jgi:hypothetical protein
MLELSQRVEKMVKEESSKYSEEGAVNMRDLSRFMRM